MTHAEIIAEMRFHGQQNIDAEKDKPEYGILTAEGRIARNYADRLEAAYKREIDVLKQRCAELDAEIAAKDEVIKRLNDAIAEEQRRKMATAEKSSAVGDAAKLREALGNLRAELWNNTVIAGKRKFELYEIADAALAARPRNCDLPEVAKGQPKLAEQAWRVFKRSHKDSNPDSYGLLRCIRWLLAPAPEKEGAAK